MNIIILFANAHITAELSALINPKENSVHKISHFEQLTETLVQSADMLIAQAEIEHTETLPTLLEIRTFNPNLLFILLVEECKATQIIQGFKSGIFDVLTLPLQKNQMSKTLQKSHVRTH